MLVNCGKKVQKLVKKSAQKPCNLFVQKSQNVEKETNLECFAHFLNNNSVVLQNILNWFYTRFLAISSLLLGSFAPFPHRTTITTTLLINKKENF